MPVSWQKPIHSWIAHLAAAGLSRQTLATRRDHVQRIARALRGDPWAVDADELIEWAAEQTWARETRRSVYASARSFWAWAVDAGHVAANPAAKLPKVRASEPKPRPAPEIIYQTALTGVRHPRVRLMLRLAAEAGMRRAEVAQLHAGRDLVPDLLGWTIIAHGKGGKDRAIPISDDLAAEVRAAGAGGWCFPGRIEGHLSARYVGELVAEAMPGVWTMHTLRHRFATRAADQGDLIAVQKLLGHASVATTQRYVARPDEALRRAALAASLSRPALDAPDADAQILDVLVVPRLRLGQVAADLAHPLLKQAT